MLDQTTHASLNFEEFKTMTYLCNQIFLSLGNNEKKFLKSETILKNILLRKFVTTKKINKGVFLNKNSINTYINI